MEFKKQERLTQQREKKRGKPEIILLTIENKLRVAGEEMGRRWVNWVRGIKVGICDEHWVLYVSDESLNPTPETNMYVNCMLTNWNLNQNLEEKKRMFASFIYFYIPRTYNRTWHIIRAE